MLPPSATTRAFAPQYTPRLEKVLTPRHAKEETGQATDQIGHDFLPPQLLALTFGFSSPFQRMALVAAAHSFANDLPFSLWADPRRFSDTQDLRAHLVVTLYQLGFHDGQTAQIIGRDRTSVVCIRRTHRDRMVVEPDFAAQYIRLFAATVARYHGRTPLHAKEGMGEVTASTAPDAAPTAGAAQPC